MMNALFRMLSLFTAISLLTSACGGQNASAQTVEATNVTVISYQVVLGKSVNDQSVADFITSNNCSAAAEFQLCRDSGIAFWADADQIVKTVYLYSGYADGFRRFRGELPYGLTFYDPMWRVEEKLMDLDSANTLYQAGLPDETGSPDHMHYRAMYKRLGMTVIYNSPGADEDAYIYAVVVSK